MIIKHVNGYRGYFVTDTGEVFSTRQGSMRKMVPNLVGRGYLAVGLRNDRGKTTNEYIHRMVLSAFVKPQPSTVLARHLDKDVQNNNLSNLKWHPRPVKLTEAEKTLKRFHEAYTPVTESGCWLWERTTGKGGYGEFVLPGKTRKAHRASWILHHGDIPDGMLICHTCDNPGCVNPQHLFLGTPKDNTGDRISKGRFVGENHPRAKLSVRDVWEIKQIHPYCRAAELALIYGVSACAIRDVIFERNWGYVKTKEAVQNV